MGRLPRIAGFMALACLAGGAAAKPQPSSTYLGLSRAAMIAAVKTAPLKLIDNLETNCDAGTTIGAWLTQLTATEARSVAWTAGKCDLANNLNPLDAGGRYCVQASIRLKHPTAKDDTPELEFYLEDPKRGKLGAVYAFRDVFVTDGDLDYERDRRTFQLQWRDRFKDAPPPPCEDG